MPNRIFDDESECLLLEIWCGLLDITDSAMMLRKAKEKEAASKLNVALFKMGTDRKVKEMAVHNKSTT